MPGICLAYAKICGKAYDWLMTGILLAYDIAFYMPGICQPYARHMPDIRHRSSYAWCLAYAWNITFLGTRIPDALAGNESEPPGPGRGPATGSLRVCRTLPVSLTQSVALALAHGVPILDPGSGVRAQPESYVTTITK